MLIFKFTMERPNETMFNDHIIMHHAIKRFKSGLSIVLLAILTISMANAENRFLTFGTGYSHYKVRNTNMSPLLYTGSTIFSDFGYVKLSNQKIDRFDFLSWAGSVKPSINPDLTNSNMTFFRLDFDYMYMHSMKIWKETDLNWFAGGAWTTKNGFRLHNKYYNNNFDFDVISSLNVATAIRKSLLINNHPVEITYHLLLPVLSYTIGPSYSYVLPEDYIVEPEPNAWTFLKSGQFVSLNHLQRVNSLLDISYYINNGNAFRLSYHWDFINNKSTNQIISANHGFTLSTLFKF